MFLQRIALIVVITVILVSEPAASITRTDVERWDFFELSLSGPENGNPFRDVVFSAEFSYKRRTIEVEGFYDWDGVYRVRFMPDTEGEWHYVTHSNRRELDGEKGSFTCVAPSPGNHGPVRVRHTYHFGYADGTPYYPVGTTCYAWIHQGDELEEQTLETLRTSPFNKIRMCVFPKWYIYNRKEPVYYPFEGTPPKEWDFTRFNPAFFRHLEKRVGELRDMGIEADIILFHPYDKGHWGFDTLDDESENYYLRYLVARLAAYRNVWWSMANEYDLFANKTMDDWDRYFRIVQESDPYHHLRSVHNWQKFYDFLKPWVTHCSVQTPITSRGLEEIAEWRLNFKKPLIVDECLYEGNIDMRWGNISAREMVHRFWLGYIAGCYVTHGECYLNPEETIWWSKGGKLVGESPARIAFLKKIMEEGPPEGIEPIAPWRIWRRLTAGREGEYYLLYTSFHQPLFWTFELPEGKKYRFDIIDTWEMTVTPVEGTIENGDRIELPGKPYIAIRLRRIP